MRFMHFKGFSSSSKHLIQIEVRKKVMYIQNFNERENETLKNKSNY